MLSLILLSTALAGPTAALPSGGAAGAPATPAAASATVTAAREEAADVLGASLDVAGKLDDEGSAAALLMAAAETAGESLGESALAGDLQQMLAEARARRADEPGAVAAMLEEGLRRTLGDLEFEPVMEAALPEGFPPPTPVGEIEVKDYPLYRIARAGSGGNGAFWQLFQHIQKHDIPMTAPVEMTYDATGDEVDMAFMYEFAAQGTPGPDGSVEVTDIPPMLVASIGCRGWSSETSKAEALVKLRNWIDARDDLELAGPVRRFGYNGPSVRGDRRYYEIQIPVRRVKSTEVAEASGEDLSGWR